ncbi:MAG: hypothetical protein U5R06_12170 [candidate division KSB1 bacterium]|nr:hypothetical protein [candidate division KSB1 bacterium]
MLVLVQACVTWCACLSWTLQRAVHLSSASWWQWRPRFLTLMRGHGRGGGDGRMHRSHPTAATFDTQLDTQGTEATA